MSVSAVIVMIIAMVLIWGGLAASVMNAVKSSK